MKRLLFWIMVLAVLAGSAAAGYNRFCSSRFGAGGGPYRLKKVRRGDVTLTVNSTGTVKPVRSVQIGAFVSGPILKVLVDFNDKVKKDQILAQIDPRNYEAALAHERAALAHDRADLVRVKALLEQAIHTERRAQRLKPAKAISDTDFDQTVTDRKSLEAQIKLAEACIQECEANVRTAETNLAFTEIRSPVDGIVTDREVDPGQTMAAQFQTPVMFVVAPDLEKKVHVYASVDEADIGLIREAKQRNEPVSFTVDAYPKDTFQGRIAEVRLNPTTVSNVVTYTVVVSSPNVELKLLPGMTANLSFQIQRRAGVLTLPNAAFRFHPKPEQVRPADRAIVEGRSDDDTSGEDDAPAQAPQRHYVWIVEDGLLAAVEVDVGLSDKSVTEIVSGKLAAGQEVVVGAQGASTAAAKKNSGPPPPPM